MSQGSNAEGGKKGRKKIGKKRKREKEGVTFRLPSSILFATWQEVESYPQDATEESDGDESDNEGGWGDEPDNKGDGGDRECGTAKEGAEERDGKEGDGGG